MISQERIDDITRQLVAACDEVSWKVAPCGDSHPDVPRGVLISAMLGARCFGPIAFDVRGVDRVLAQLAASARNLLVRPGTRGGTSRARAPAPSATDGDISNGGLHDPESLAAGVTSSLIDRAMATPRDADVEVSPAEMHLLESQRPLCFAHGDPATLCGRSIAVSTVPPNPLADSVAVSSSPAPDENLRRRLARLAVDISEGNSWTVRDLIEELGRFPSDLKVGLVTEAGWVGNVTAAWASQELRGMVFVSGDRS